MPNIIGEELEIKDGPTAIREFRLYAFVNFYLSSIQQGIQTGHAAVDLVRKYTRKGSVFSEQSIMAEEWADYHKTFITLNGGANRDLHAIKDLVSQLQFPWVTFQEDEPSLGGILTCVAVVLPDDIFNVERKTNIHGDTVYSWTRTMSDGSVIIYMYRKEDPEFAFIDRLKSCGLAK